MSGGVGFSHSCNGRSLSGDGSHTVEVVLCWGLVEQARHEHMSDEYKSQYIIDVPPSPSRVKVCDTTVVPSELLSNRGKVKRTSRPLKYVLYIETKESIIASYWPE